MRASALGLWITFVALGPVAWGEENPCTNGSFEKLDPRGFPEDWQGVGQKVEATNDAHIGRLALRMLRTADAKGPETGLNRDWQVHSAQRGAMIDRLKGGIDFWYKAVSADAAELRVYAIPMTADPIEKTKSPRATFAVPPAHVGDGQWHHARLRYDFTGDPTAKWVHFAARITGKAGELLLDDVSYVQRVGTILRFGRIHLEEDPASPGRRGVLKALVVNAGDVPAKDLRVTVKLPEGLTAQPDVLRPASLAVDDSVRAAWTIEGDRDKARTLALTAAAGEAAAHASFDIAPKLVIESFGPVAPVAVEGEPIVLECVLSNPGSAFVTGASATFRCDGRDITKPLKRLPPGAVEVLRASFERPRKPGAPQASVEVIGGHAAQREVRKTTFTFAEAVEPPAPSGKLRALATQKCALLENEHVRLVLRRVAGPEPRAFGVGELWAKTRDGWGRVAWLAKLAAGVWRDQGGDVAESWSSGAPPIAKTTDAVAELRLSWPDKGVPAGTVTFALQPGRRTISCVQELQADRDRALLALEGPQVYALDRDEAVFPGLEWLVDTEVSSSTLDIAAGHPDQVRYVVHPDMVTIPAIAVHGKGGTVALLWDLHQKWDAKRMQPSVVFASPDRWANQQSHLMGLFLPSVPEFVEPNERLAARPYPLKAGQTLRLACRIYADGQATDPLGVIDEYLRLYGLPEPAPLPHGTWDAEIQFSMRAYLESLWDAETKQWWTGKGGNPLMCGLARPREFIADLLLGATVSPDPQVRSRCTARAKEVLDEIGGEMRWDAQRLGERADLAMASPGLAASVLGTMGDDGAWRFDADRKDQGVFKGLDYYELGPDGAVEVGTCAQKAYVVLRYARIAGDWDAYEQMHKTLALMERFRVPRAAQVWEVPVHTPDILAAADAVDAYVEAYRFSGDERWLKDAIGWARRGLPFVYLWGDAAKPWLLGGSIPVLGATWFQGSWFGRPVQWNGLRYANALLKLAEHDKTRPWRQVAELLIRSAVHQQDAAGPNAALWPDNVSAIDGKKCPWVFAPRQIIRNICKLTGRDEDASTVIVGTARRRLHVSAVAKIGDAAWDAPKGLLTFRVDYPKGTQGVVLVSNVSRPAGVSLNGKAILERPDVEKGAQPGWRYDPAFAYLAVRVAGDGASAVCVEGAEFREVVRLPRLATSINFGFDQSAEGWAPHHDIARFEVRDGVLWGAITGPDPYLVRTRLRVAGESCPVIRLRMRLTAGKGGQLFWTTQASPGFGEDKTLRFEIQADGEFHEYRLEPGRDPKWAAQTITALRIDPGGGGASGEFALDYVRGVKE